MKRTSLLASKWVKGNIKRTKCKYSELYSEQAVGELYQRVLKILRFLNRYLTYTEWSTLYGGKKEGSEKDKFRRLPFDHCCVSLHPYERPCCDSDGNIFDLQAIIGYLKKFKHNPVTGKVRKRLVSWRNISVSVTLICVSRFTADGYEKADNFEYGEERRWRVPLSRLI